MLAYNWDREHCPLYGVAGCPLFRGCLSIEVNGMVIGIFRMVPVRYRPNAASGGWGYGRDLVSAAKRGSGINPL